MEKNKIKKSAAVFASTLIIIIVGVASFAYFGTFDVNLINNVAVNINAVSPGNASFVSNATQLNLQVPAANMSKTNAGNIAAENTATLTVNLTGAADLLTTCTYDIVYEYDADSYVYGYGETPVTDENVGPDIVLAILDGTSLDDEIMETTNGINYYSIDRPFNYFEGSDPYGKFDENDKWDSFRKRVLVRNASISSTGELITQNWLIAMAYVNLPVSQEKLAGKAFTGKIYVENYDCGTKEIKPAYETILMNNANNATSLEEAQNIIKQKETPDFSKVATENEGMYAAQDDLGTSYYFRGAVNNNWVKFGKYSSDYIRYKGYLSTTNTAYRMYDSMNDCTSATSYNVNCEAVKKASKGDDIYWRIIRINGDGSIRMIYSGTTDPMFDSSVVSSNGVYMAKNDLLTIEGNYNNSKTNSEHVGYQYIEGEQHGYGKCDAVSCTVNGKTVYNSTIKQTLERWYTSTSLADTDATKVADTIYCNDRSASSNQTGAWASTGVRYNYGVYSRLYSVAPTPTLICPTETDMFTMNEILVNGGTKTSNGALTYPVGLITADEIAMVGNNYKTVNINSFLYTGKEYWSNTPIIYSSSNPLMFNHTGSGDDGKISFGSGNVNNYHEIRSVISLDSSVKFLVGDSDGTYTNPYVVE